MNMAQIYFDLYWNWQNITDILLIASGLFFLYRTLLRLGTWKIFAGMLTAFMVYVIASIFNLEGTEWIFKNVSHVALIGLIIIFQPELRKIFEKMVSLALSPRKVKSDNASELIADSLWSLAQQKRGAIIVFPGKELIQEKISGGYKLNALPSKPLIASIFDPHSGGHDGALIIDNGLLTEFAVRLPISSSSKIPNEYGTRHHAALGISEEKDVLALLVSEERGHVMSFVGGTMKRLSTPEEIVSAINVHYKRCGLQQKVRQFSLSRHTVLQIAGSLAVALCFWTTMIVGEKQMIERAITIPIEYTSPTEGLMFLGKRVNELVVHTAGPKSAIDDFLLSGPKAVVNLSKLEAGDQQVVMSGDNIKHPDDIRLLDITPPDIPISLVPLSKRHVEVVPQMIGQLPPSFTVQNVEVLPKSIEIIGPPVSDGDKEVVIATTPIYLNSIQQNTTIICKIVAPPSIQPIDKRWPDVEVRITLVRKTTVPEGEK